MIANIFTFILDTLGTLFGSVLLLRAYLQFARVHPRNALSQFVIALTDWIVLPLRRVIPGTRGVDWASVVAAFVCAMLLVFLLFLLSGAPLATFSPILIGLACLWLVKWTLYLIMWLTLLQAILSWVNPYAPIAPVLNQITAPFLSPIRRVVPPIGGVDLSALVLLLLVQLCLYVLGQLTASLFGFGV